MDIIKTFFVLFCLTNLLLVFAKRDKRGKSNYIDVGYGHHTVKHCECGRENNPNITKTYKKFVKPRQIERIINGADVSLHQYPWLVAILHLGFIQCGGSIISDMYVLSAAHCKNDSFRQEDIKVLVGDHDLCTTDTDNTIFSVTRIIQHPKFNPSNFNADLMLLRTNMRITFNKYIRPICIPQYDYQYKDVNLRYAGKNGTVVGWGATNVNQTSIVSCLPKQIELPILARKECRYITSSTLFCAGFLKGEGDACQGDSGGPFQIKNIHNGRYELIGIVSNGIGCAEIGIPGLYTDVIQYIPWIWKQVSFDSRTCW